MIINAQTLDLAVKGFKTVYTDAYLQAPSFAEKIFMKVPSQSRDESYGWLGQFPQLREWIGARVVHNLKFYGFTITNRMFESTVSVSRNDIADDRMGVFKPMFSEMGQLARRHPEELVFGLIKNGFSSLCFDGQNFFDTDHPIIKDEQVELVSNMQAGTGPAWFLFDTSRGVRPVIWQERESYEFQGMTDPENPNVCLNNAYVYGVRARVNAGFCLWLLAFGSKAALNAENYAAARAAMMNFCSDGGRKLGVSPTVLVVPPALEFDARNILNAETTSGGGTNVWRNTAELIITPYVA